MMSRGPMSMFSGMGADGAFVDPFLDASSAAIPTNFRNAMYWAQYIYMRFNTYAMAQERIISYFLTEIELLNASEEEEEKYTTFLNNTLNTIGALQDLLRDRACYGNGFASVVVPFKRFLVCGKPGCGTSRTLHEIGSNPAYNFHWEMPKFRATCPKCGYSGEWKVDDKTDDEETRIKIKRWSPLQIETVHDMITDECLYFWRIPEDYKRQIKQSRQGNTFHLERAPMPVIKAIAANQLFLFKKDAIFHLKEPTLSGLFNRGWGFPRILTNFRQIWYVQVLRRYNEAIALDYVVPFRVITPAPRPGGGGSGGMASIGTDPFSIYNGLDFRNQALAMIRKRRRDPASIQIMPMPVQFQMFGADANQIAPRDLLDQGMETLLNDVGTPIELYNGSLQLQTAPVALRLFESTFHYVPHDANGFLRWLVRQCAEIMQWEIVEAKLRSVTIADNLEKQMAVLQLMASQMVSGTTALKGLGLKWKEEKKQMAEEARTDAELQARTQEEMEQEGFAQQIAKGQLAGAAPGGGGAPAGPGGAPPPGGAPAGGQPQGMMSTDGTSMQGPVSSYIASMGPNTPQTPTDMIAAANQIADGLLGMPDAAKDGELRQLKTYNQAMHDHVIARMEEKRRGARAQGGAQVMQQMYGRA